MKRAVLPMLVLVVLALPAHADAPTGQYEPFAKDLKFILDLKTQLRWQRFPDTKERSPAQAEQFCEASDPQWGGPGGWRLPTVKELLTLVDEEPHDEFDVSLGVSSRRYIDRNAFAGTPTLRPFVALSDDPTNNVWSVDFGKGTATQQQGGTYYVRCVRAE